MCWLYSVPNFLVIQHLETLYLGGNNVRVVFESVKNWSSVCIKRQLVIGSRDWLTNGDLPVARSNCKTLLNAHILSFFTLFYTQPLHYFHLNTEFLNAKLQENLVQNKANTWLIKFNLTMAKPIFQYISTTKYTLTRPRCRFQHRDLHEISVFHIFLLEDFHPQFIGIANNFLGRLFH